MNQEYYDKPIEIDKKSKIHISFNIEIIDLNNFENFQQTKQKEKHS